MKLDEPFPIQICEVCNHLMHGPDECCDTIPHPTTDSLYFCGCDDPRAK